MLFNVVYADCPWHYAQRCTWSTQDPSAKTRFGGGAHETYPLMSDYDILEMGSLIKSITDKNSLLFLWATGPKMPVCIDVLEAWGFNWATIGFVWTKLYKKKLEPCLGPGFYTASNSEYVLIGSKGKPGLVKNGRNLIPMNREDDVIVPDDWTLEDLDEYLRSARQEHSRKPDEIRDRIRELVGPQARCVELFARQTTPGWASYGNEITGRDIREDLEANLGGRGWTDVDSPEAECGFGVCPPYRPEELTPDQLTGVSLVAGHLVELLGGGLPSNAIFKALGV